MKSNIEIIDRLKETENGFVLKEKKDLDNTEVLMSNRAIYYITRKKKRSLIILIVVTVVFSSLYVSLNVIKSTTHLKNSISRTAQTSLSISKKDQSFFDHKAFEETKNYILQYNGIIKPKQIKVIEAMQSI